MAQDADQSRTEQVSTTGESELFGTRVVEVPAAEAETPAIIEPELGIPSEPVPAVVSQLLMFGDVLEIARARKAARKSPVAAKSPNQLALF